MWPERFCFSENASSENSAEEGRGVEPSVPGGNPTHITGLGNRQFTEKRSAVAVWLP
jgi:hypothetical protein